MSLRKGANVPVSANRVRVEVGWRGGPGALDVDASVLLLTTGRKVRTDDDFVFYNQPAHPSGSVRLEGKGQDGAGPLETIRVELSAVERQIGTVMVAASADRPFSQVSGLFIRVLDAESGAEAARFDVTDATTETALLLGELYRRKDAWKFRAVGQGYASGLAGLATDFGVTVDDPPPAAAPITPPPPAAEPAPEPAPARPPAPAAEPAPARPPAPPAPAPRQTPPPTAPLSTHSATPGAAAAPSQDCTKHSPCREVLAIPPAERDSLLRLIIAKTSDLGSDGIYFYLNDELVALLVAMGPGESGRQQRAFPVLGHLTSRWNTTPPELLMRALENMRRDDVQVESREQGKNSPLYMVTDQGVSGVAHLVRLEELLGFDLPHGAIVGIPREHAIVAVPIRMSSDVASIEPMHQLVTSVGSEASDGLSTDVFWFHRGQLHPLNARSKDGKLEEIFPPDGFLEFIEKLPRG